MFGHRQRHTEEIVDLLRQQIANDVRARTAVVQAVTSVQATLENDVREMERSSATTDVAVEHLWRKVIQQEQALTAAVDHLAQVCAALTGRIDAEARERRALIETVTRVLTVSGARPRVLGGTVYAAEPDEASDRLFPVGAAAIDTGSPDIDLHSSEVGLNSHADDGARAAHEQPSAWRVALEGGS